jgi:hypothetical protein
MAVGETGGIVGAVDAVDFGKCVDPASAQIAGGEGSGI